MTGVTLGVAEAELDKCGAQGLTLTLGVLKAIERSF